MQNRGGGALGGGVASEDGAALAARAALARLPAAFDLAAAAARYPPARSASLNTVLVQEMARFNGLLAVVRASLGAIDLALQGLVLMSGEAEAAFRAIALNRVPAAWAAASYPSLLSLGAYIADLAARVAMLQDWFERGPPAEFWLPGFFFAQSFLTAALQDFARCARVPVDAVDFEVIPLAPAPAAGAVGAGAPQGPAGPGEGVVVHGLFLEGARWDEAAMRLAESAPRELYAPAPRLWLRPRRTADMAVQPGYMCPLYRTPERRGTLATTGHSTNFVMLVRLPTLLPPEHWTLRGAALLCQQPE